MAKSPFFFSRKLTNYFIENTKETRKKSDKTQNFCEEVQYHEVHENDRQMWFPMMHCERAQCEALIGSNVVSTFGAKPSRSCPFFKRWLNFEGVLSVFWPFFGQDPASNSVQKFLIIFENKGYVRLWHQVSHCFRRYFTSILPSIDWAGSEKKGAMSTFLFSSSMCFY